MTGLEKVYEKNEDVVFRQIVDEVILVPVRNKVADLNCIYTLNEVGAFIWSQIDGKKSLAKISELLVNSFSVSKDTAQEEVSAFTGQLESKKLVEEIRT